MTRVTVAALFVYPIKSARGIAVRTAEVEPRGFRHDRRFMIVGPDGTFLTQREHPRLALVDVALEDAEGPDARLRVGAGGTVGFEVPLGVDGPPRRVRVWRDTCDAISAGSEAARWLTAHVGAPCELVRMPEGTRRPVDPAYATAPDDVVSFADGFPFLVAGASSLDDLNARLPRPIGMERFRPNVVVAGAPAYAEDGWRDVTLGSIPFRVVKPCGRCVVTTLDPGTATGGREPLATLARYRAQRGEVHFAQNAIALARGTLAVGDEVTIAPP